MLNTPNFHDSTQPNHGFPSDNLNNPSTALHKINTDRNPQDNPHSITESNPEPKTTQKQTPWTALTNVILWTPPWCRWSPDNPPKFGLPLNFLFAFAGTFTVITPTHTQTQFKLPHRTLDQIHMDNS